VKDDPAFACCSGLPPLSRLGEGGGSGVACVTVGVMLRNDLNPTYTYRAGSQVPINVRTTL